MVGQRLLLHAVGHLVLDQPLPRARVRHLAHVARRHLVAQPQRRRRHARQQPCEAGRLAARAGRLRKAHVLVQAQVRYHAGRYRRALVLGRAVAVAPRQAHAHAHRRCGALYERRKARRHALLHRLRLNVALHVAQPRHSGRRCRHLAHLARPRRRAVEYAVLFRYEHRRAALQLVRRAGRYPVAHRPARRRQLHARHYGVAALMRRRHRAGQHVHLQQLQLQWHCAAAIALDYEHAAVHQLAPHYLRAHLVERQRALRVAVARTPPALEQRAQPRVQFRVAGVGLQLQPPAHHAAQVRLYHRIEQVAVALQIARPCAQQVAVRAVGHVGRRIRYAPAGVQPVGPRRVVVAHTVQAVAHRAQLAHAAPVAFAPVCPPGRYARQPAQPALACIHPLIISLVHLPFCRRLTRSYRRSNTAAVKPGSSPLPAASCAACSARSASSSARRAARS